jgi:hypothetical protein
LAAQKELNAALTSQVAALESKTKALYDAFQHQVYSESGVVVHEAGIAYTQEMDEKGQRRYHDDDGGLVLLCMTQTNTTKQQDEELEVQAAYATSFQVIPSYFQADATVVSPSNESK